MKKSGLLLFFLLIVPFVSALDINLSKQIYKPGETLLMSISGNLLSPIQEKDIVFLSGRQEIPIQFDFGKITEDYYLSATLPLAERNYTILLKNLHFIEARKEKTQDIEINFSVQGNVSDFSFSPGFISSDTTKNDFIIELQANFKSVAVTISFLGKSTVLNIPADEKKKVKFSTIEINKTTLAYITLVSAQQSYTIPVFIKKEPLQEERKIISFPQEFLNLTFSPGKEVETEILFLSAGVFDLELSVSDSLKNFSYIEKEKIKTTGEKQGIIIRLKSEKEGIVTGTITARTGNETAVLPVYLFIAKNETPLSQLKTISGSELGKIKRCSELQGKLCKSEEKCIGTISPSIDGGCCVGTCSPKETQTKGSGKLIWGIIILILLAIILFFVYKKYKKAKPQQAGDILNKKREEYESRFTKPDVKEVKGSLSRS